MKIGSYNIPELSNDSPTHVFGVFFNTDHNRLEFWWNDKILGFCEDKSESVMNDWLDSAYQLIKDFQTKSIIN